MTQKQIPGSAHELTGPLLLMVCLGLFQDTVASTNKSAIQGLLRPQVLRQSDPLLPLRLLSSLCQPLGLAGSQRPEAKSLHYQAAWHYGLLNDLGQLGS